MVVGYLRFKVGGKSRGVGAQELASQVKGTVLAAGDRFFVEASRGALGNGKRTVTGALHPCS